MYLFNTNDLRNGTSEAWQLSIDNNTGNGIASNENNGTITVNGVTLTANSDFSTAGNRAADRAAIIDAINRLTTFSAGEVGACEESNSLTCIIRITSDSLSNLASNVVAISSLSNTNLSSTADGSTGSTVAWGAANANTGLKAPGGTGGIVVDNNSSTPGASQIYFTQQAAGGNAIQASQSGLQ